MMNSQCENCPVADPNKPCMAVLAPDEFGYYCTWDKSDDMKRRIIVGRSAYGITRVRVAVQPAKPGLPVSESVALIHAMKACPHWVASSDCGCAGANKCLLGKGQGGIVNHADCFACLLAQRV